MWNPVLDYNDVRPAVLEGWHRAFCIRLIAGRGTECQPGRMLALQSGGRTRGRVFRLSDDNRAEELELLWKREMLTGCYCPRWEAVTLDDGQQIIALVFTINPLHPLFESDNSPSVIAPLIAAAKGLSEQMHNICINWSAVCRNSENRMTLCYPWPATSDNYNNSNR